MTYEGPRFVFAVQDFNPVVCMKWRMLVLLMLTTSINGLVLVEKGNVEYSDKGIKLAYNKVISPLVGAAYPKSKYGVPDTMVLWDSGSAATVCPVGHAPHVPCLQKQQLSVPLLGAGEGHGLAESGETVVEYRTSKGYTLALNYTVATCALPYCFSRNFRQARWNVPFGDQPCLDWHTGCWRRRVRMRWRYVLVTAVVEGPCSSNWSSESGTSRQ